MTCRAPILGRALRRFHLRRSLHRSLRLLCVAGLAVWPALATAQDVSLLEARRAQIEALRAEVASQLQLQAYDLLDELVFQWAEAPVFDQETLVVLADVTAPVGFGSGLGALLENHVVSLLSKNPAARLRLAHCPRCTSVLVHATAQGTLVSRGVDQPGVLAEAGATSGARHALFLDFEVEGAALVLRARVTALEAALPIVYARTLSTSTASPALLRSSERLKSAPAARQEYLDALLGRSAFLVPVHLGVRAYATDPVATLKAPPSVWLEAGLEVAMTQARAWTATVSAGATWTPELQVGWLGQARIARLLSGTATSLTAPDLFAFVGGALIGIHGRGAAVFKDTVPTIEDLTRMVLGQQSTSFIYGAFQVGLELRVKNRIGITVFLESAPALNGAPAIGRFLDLAVIQFHTLGVEASFCF